MRRAFRVLLFVVALCASIIVLALIAWIAFGGGLDVDLDYDRSKAIASCEQLAEEGACDAGADGGLLCENGSRIYDPSSYSDEQLRECAAPAAERELRNRSWNPLYWS